MAQDVAMTCDRCGEQFRGNPRSQPLGGTYCSLACEEGRSPLPMSDPASDGFHLHLQGEPDALVGMTLVAEGLKLVDYSPEWAKNPSDYKSRRVVDVDEENETLVRKDSVVLGQVVGYGGGKYMVEHENMETGELTVFHVKDTQAVHQIRKGRWWAE